MLEKQSWNLGRDVTIARTNKYQEYDKCMQQQLFEHVSEEGHHSFLEDVSITLINKTDPSNPLQREKYCRSTLKTMGL